MKLSTFNFVIPVNDDQLIVYNTLSGAIMKLHSHLYNTENATLIKHKFVVPDSCNEIELYKFRYLSAIYSTQSWQVTIAPTMQCNFNCPYCFEGNNKGGNVMTDEVIGSIKNFIKSKSNKPIAITWFGGEPFLGWKAISDISEFLIKENIQFDASAITNGSICTNEIIEKIDSYKIKRLQITLDGIGNQHDSKRKFKDGSSSFDLIISNIHRYLKETDVKISIRVNIDKTNASSFSNLRSILKLEFKDFFKQKRVKISPSPVLNRTQFNGCSSCFSIDEYYKFEQSYLPFKKSLPKFIGPCPLRSRSSIGIGPDGAIYKCLEHFGDSSKSIGSILNSNVDLQKEAHYSVGSLPFDIKPCVSCKLLPICGGGCAVELSKYAEGKGVLPCSINMELVKNKILRYYENS